MGKSGKLSLEDELASLRQKYVRCGDCPPERNCCTFQGMYSLIIEEQQLSALFDEEGIERLLEGEEKLFCLGEGQYELRDMRCPALGCGNRCTLYERRKELGFDACLDYPLYVDYPLYALGKERPGRYSHRMVVADYRCHSMEEHWDELSPALRELAERFNVTVYVRYFTEQDYGGDLPLDDFDRLREAGGVIPPQKMG